MADADGRVVVIGAGLGGLAPAVRLAHAGLEVTVLEALNGPGGKMRCLPSAAGPVDAGPTVLTLRHVFDSLFAACGASLDERVRLLPEPLLARHYWRDGSRLDLHSDRQARIAAIGAFAGARAAAEYRRFAAGAARLFDAFDAPMMQAAAPSRGALSARALRDPGLVAAMATWASLAGRLQGCFTDPRLRQLFGRYATYVGGVPGASPALLSLISMPRQAASGGCRAAWPALPKPSPRSPSKAAPFSFTPTPRPRSRSRTAASPRCATPPERATRARTRSSTATPGPWSRGIWALPPAPRCRRGRSSRAASRPRSGPSRRRLGAPIWRITPSSSAPTQRPSSDRSAAAPRPRIRRSMSAPRTAAAVWRRRRWSGSRPSSTPRPCRLPIPRSRSHVGYGPSPPSPPMA